MELPPFQATLPRGVGPVATLAAFGILLVVVAAHPPALRADDSVRAAQSVLAARGFYFGTPDGQPGATTADALRRFQIREGLPVTGKLDDPTSRALGVPPAGSVKPAPSPTPGVVPPHSADADRDFLRQNGLVTAKPTPAPTTVTKPTPRPPAAVAPRAPRPAASPSAGPNVFTNLPPPPPRGGRGPDAAPSNILPAEAAAFLRRYLTAGAGDDPIAEAAFFAPDVDYFNNGRVSRRFVARDQSAYRRRWPFRRYELEREPELVSQFPDGSAEVRYLLRYSVESPARVASGRTAGEIRIRRVPGGEFEIISIKEKAS